MSSHLKAKRNSYDGDFELEDVEREIKELQALVGDYDRCSSVLQNELRLAHDDFCDLTRTIPRLGGRPTSDHSDRSEKLMKTIEITDAYEQAAINQAPGLKHIDCQTTVPIQTKTTNYCIPVTEKVRPNQPSKSRSELRVEFEATLRKSLAKYSKKIKNKQNNLIQSIVQAYAGMKQRIVELHTDKSFLQEQLTMAEYEKADALYRIELQKLEISSLKDQLSLLLPNLDSIDEALCRSLRKSIRKSV